MRQAKLLPVNPFLWNCLVPYCSSQTEFGPDLEQLEKFLPHNRLICSTSYLIFIILLAYLGHW